MDAPVIWINGTFGAGKTTLAEALHARLPDALPFDPEYVGYLLARWTPPASTDDFQDLELWRHLVVEFAVGMVRQYQRPLVVPMTLINPSHRQDVLGGVQAAGVPLVHVFLHLDREVLRHRITEQVLDAEDADADASARAFRLAHVDQGMAAVDGLPAGTLLLRSDEQDPSQLAEAVLSRLHGR